MNKPLAFALVTATFASLTGCGIQIERVKEDDFYSVPTTTSPWRSLSSGVDVHWWFRCFKGPDKQAEPSCESMEMVALRRGAVPDWRLISRTRQSHASVSESESLVPVLSAHSGTPRRLLGMEKNGRSEFYILAVGGDDLADIDRLHSYDRLIQIDVWHNAMCSGLAMPVPRLVVEDERSLWVFADAGDDCAKMLGDLRAPLDMMTFDHPELHRDLLRKRMQLFYLNRAEPNEADFRQPRLATSDAQLLARSRRRVVDMASVPTPAGKVFTLEDGRIATPLPLVLTANTRCSYTTTYIGWTILSNSPSRKLVGCKPYVVAGARSGR